MNSEDMIRGKPVCFFYKFHFSFFMILFLPLKLALFALNIIDNLDEPSDWIHVKFRTFLSFKGPHPNGFKFNVSISNPSFEKLPPVKIIFAIRPFDSDNGCHASQFIHEHIHIDPIDEGTKIHKEINFNKHTVSLKTPFTLSINCFPIFESNESDWHFPPLYNTVITSLDLLLNDEEMEQIRRRNPKIKITSFGNKLVTSEFFITSIEALQLAMKELFDITESDILASLFHYKYAKCDNNNPIRRGFVLIDKELIQVEIKVKTILPRLSNNAFQIQIITNEATEIINKRLKNELSKKLKAITQCEMYSKQKPSRPVTIVWDDKHLNAEPSRSYDIFYEPE